MREHPGPLRLPVALLGFVAVALPAQTIITPSSATATSQFSGAYDIGNTIDGSGLPVGFGLSDVHANYTGDNHWTTNGTTVSAQSATFNFATPQTLTHFFLWNHRSNAPPANSPNYYVTQFDLIFRDGSDNVLWTENNLTAISSASVQFYSFPEVSGVASVIFDIDTNAGEAYTGLAEIRFGYQAIPEPATIGLWLGGAALLALRLRRRAMA